MKRRIKKEIKKIETGISLKKDTNSKITYQTIDRVNMINNVLNF